MTIALHFRIAREVLDKARRENARYKSALARDERVEAGDHLFNFAVTILAVRDWIIATAPAHEADAKDLVLAEPAIARLVDSANIAKHHALTQKSKADPAIVGQTFTDVAVPAPLSELAIYTLKSKANLADKTRGFQEDDADAAIA